METFEEFLNTVDDEEKRVKLKIVLDWVQTNYPHFDEEVKWKQPMFSNEGTYMIGFSVAKNHVAVSPEKAGITKFEDELQERGYNPTAMIFRVPWNKEMDYDLLKRIIDFQEKDKKGYGTYWRKA